MLSAPRGDTPHPRSGAEARRTPRKRVVAKRSYTTSKVRASGRVCQAATEQEQPRRATPNPRPGAVAGKSNPTPEARGGSREEPHDVQRAVAALVQEGLEEPSHVEGQEVWREEIPSSKVRSSGCTLLESREEIPHAQGKRNPSKMVGVARGH